MAQGDCDFPHISNMCISSIYRRERTGGERSNPAPKFIPIESQSNVVGLVVVDILRGLRMETLL